MRRHFYKRNKGVRKIFGPLWPRRTRDHRLCLSSGCLLKRATKGNYGKSHEMCHVIIACKSAPRKALKALSGRRGRQAGQGQNMCRNDRDGAGGKAGDPGGGTHRRQAGKARQRAGAAKPSADRYGRPGRREAGGQAMKKGAP